MAAASLMGPPPRGPEKFNAGTRYTSEVVRGAVTESALFLLILGACLFGAGGTLRWPAAWAVVVLYTATCLLGLLVLDRELLAVRAGPEPRGQRGDFALASTGFLLLFPVMFIVAGLDAQRYRWSPPLPAAARMVALAVFVLGQGLALWAAHSNRFLVKVVRIQTERGHRVVSHGPYAYLRHPAYAGSIAAQLAMPVILGSLWSLIPAAAGAALFAVRTSREDEFLCAELRGYRAYAESVRWRLVPGIW